MTRKNAFEGKKTTTTNTRMPLSISYYYWNINDILSLITQRAICISTIPY